MQRKHSKVRTVMASLEPGATLTRLKSLQHPAGEGHGLNLRKCAALCDHFLSFPIYAMRGSGICVGMLPGGYNGTDNGGEQVQN